MGLPLSRQSHQPTKRTTSGRPTSVCRVHTCLRCHASTDTGEPCSFVVSLQRICGPCAGQQQVLTHMTIARTPWGAGMARTRRP